MIPGVEHDPCHAMPCHAMPCHLPIYPSRSSTHPSIPSRPSPSRPVPSRPVLSASGAVPCRAVPCHPIPLHSTPLHAMPCHTIKHAIKHHVDRPKQISAPRCTPSFQSHTQSRFSLFLRTPLPRPGHHPGAPCPCRPMPHRAAAPPEGALLQTPSSRQWYHTGSPCPCRPLPHIAAAPPPGARFGTH